MWWKEAKVTAPTTAPPIWVPVPVPSLGPRHTASAFQNAVLFRMVPGRGVVVMDVDAVVA